MSHVADELLLVTEWVEGFVEYPLHSREANFAPHNNPFCTFSVFLVFVTKLGIPSVFYEHMVPRFGAVNQVLQGMFWATFHYRYILYKMGNVDFFITAHHLL